MRRVYLMLVVERNGGKLYIELTEGVRPDNCDEFFYDLPPKKANGLLDYY